MSTAIPPRRFRVEPIETTTRSSKNKSQEPPQTRTSKVIPDISPDSTKMPAGTLENGSQDKLLENTRPKPIRRFAPQPIETSTRSSKGKQKESNTEIEKPCRKFAPEPIETTTRTHRKFAPQPIETTARSNRRSEPIPIVITPRSSSRKKFADEWEQQTILSPKKSKKFPPQLIETAQRSRKATDTTPTVSPLEGTDTGAEEVISARQARILGIPPTPPTNTPTIELSQNPLFLEIQQRASPLARRRSYFSCSQHSFRIPDLDPIESSESEASAPSSPTTSPSITSDHSFMYKEVTRRRESVDDRSSGYLLDLAAKEAERQLREQALAAFANNEYHEPVDHFVDRDTEGSISSNDEAKRRRESSSGEMNWELQALRKHQEQVDAKKAKQTWEYPPNRRISRRKPAADKSDTPTGFLDAAMVKKLAYNAKDPELACMRKGARPPMLGKDIKFPRCASPDPARFDSTQGCDAVKTAMCYLNEQSKAAAEKGESLWCGKGNGRQTSKTPSLWSTGNSRTSSTHGLWGGLCANGGDQSPRGPTGILTPCNERAIPLSPCPTPAMSLFPPTPPVSAYGFSTDFSGIDEKLAIEQSITEDFSDDFITQVYNYLSLGYPSMARPFDEELSKISRISVADLRQDDHLAVSRGYIRLGKDGNLTDTKITEESCMRWRALRIYVQEWARQHPNMAEDASLATGTTARKGSWAL